MKVGNALLVVVLLSCTSIYVEKTYFYPFVRNQMLIPKRGVEGELGKLKTLALRLSLFAQNTN
jgi:hypothetical protein